ncbi:hypothetical protein LPB87_09860 [Flavobacterium sp. EDS]|uniref:hypothetical protein n=1 Tax=Flavobacterium sp. EDS TaxID=2897328 RepID=UPI001E5C2570|nr:hypothetical protein [Flavobacterium sp. EDS]MCD0474693.1 hypothetical protein [Flavobacterium sp. EDS]
MKNNETNRMVYISLNSIGYEIETSRINMYSIENRYSYSPFFRFRFKKIEKNDSIYNKIKLVINSFEGSLEWDMITHENTSNFIIIPKVFSDVNYLSYNNRDYYSKKYTKEKFEEFVDLSINDINELSIKISSLQKLDGVTLSKSSNE